MKHWQFAVHVNVIVLVLMYSPLLERRSTTTEAEYGFPAHHCQYWYQYFRVESTSKAIVKLT